MNFWATWRPLRRAEAYQTALAILFLIAHLNGQRGTIYENGHPRTELRLFSELGYPAELIHAVEAHATFLGVPRESLLDKALLACDELTGLILACAYVRPDKNLREVKLSSVKKKWKNRKFTEAIDRDENEHFIAGLGVDFDEHVERVLAAMQAEAEALGVAGE